MKNSQKKIKIIIVFSTMSMFLFGLIQSIETSVAATDVETDLINLDIERTTIIWKVKKSMGIFAQGDIHPNDMYKYYVYTADGTNRKYVVNYTEAPWTTGEFESTYTFLDSDYKLIKRDWRTAARDIYCVQDAAYWLSLGALRSNYTIDYSDEMIEGRLLNIVTISIYFNNTNYDIARYTRSEGILLSRHTKIDCIKSGVEIKGEFELQLESFNKPFTVSFWNYVIWFAIIFGIVLVAVVILSLIISRRQEKIRNLEY
jgi:hypothetical protein